MIWMRSFSSLLSAALIKPWLRIRRWIGWCVSVTVLDNIKRSHRNICTGGFRTPLEINRPESTTETHQPSAILEQVWHPESQTCFRDQTRGLHRIVWSQTKWFWEWVAMWVVFECQNIRLINDPRPQEKICWHPEGSFARTAPILLPLYFGHWHAEY